MSCGCCLQVVAQAGEAAWSFKHHQKPVQDDMAALRSGQAELVIAVEICQDLRKFKREVVQAADNALANLMAPPAIRDSLY